MHTGTEFFAKECFQEAAEYFSEVVRLVCEFNFDREAYVYQAKCFFKLVSSSVRINERFFIILCYSNVNISVELFLLTRKGTMKQEPAVWKVRIV